MDGWTLPGLHPVEEQVPDLPRPAPVRRVRRLLAGGHPVLLTGPSMAGKTWLAGTVAAAVAADVGAGPPLAPADGREVAELAERGLTGRVICLDDLEHHLADAALTPGVLAALAGANALLATLNDGDAVRLHPARTPRAPGADVVALFERVVVDPHRPEGVEDLLGDVAAARVAAEGVGAYVGGAARLAAHLEWARERWPLAGALLAGAADWRRGGLVRPVPRELLVALAAAYVRRGSAVDEEDWSASLAWVCRDLAGGVAPLWAVRGGYVLHPWVREQVTAVAPPLPAAGWELLLRTARPAELRAAAAAAAREPRAAGVLERTLAAAGHAGSVEAMTALAAVLDAREDRAESALRWWRRAAAAGDPAAMGRVGSALAARYGGAADAAVWFERGAAAGDPEAMGGLARLAADGGRWEEAEAWWARAAEAGHAGAAHRLGARAAAAGDSATAAACWRRAADLGDPAAANDLGVWHRDRRELRQAAARFAWAARRGYPRAMVNLGVVLEDRGRFDEAEHWYGTAAAAGFSDGMVNLAVLRLGFGDVEAALHWYGRAAEAGDARAMHGLATLLEERGASDEAQAWWARAVEAGHPRAAAALAASVAAADRRRLRAAEAGDAAAMYDLGVLADRRGDLGTARSWWTRAAAAGDRDAMFNLAVLLAERGEHAEAELWYERAGSRGDSDALYNLGVLLAGRGEVVAAGARWDQAAAAGHPRAMVALGALAARDGLDDRAETWWRKAADTGDAAAMQNLAILLRDLGRRPEAEHWWRRAAAVPAPPPR